MPEIPVAKWPLCVRLVLSPFLLVWFGALTHLLCAAVYIQRMLRCCCRGFIGDVSCGCDVFIFTDKSFPATDESIGKKLINKCRTTGGEVKWIRAHHLKDGLGNEPFRLFNKDIKGSDVRQGAVASCWLVAVMVALAETTPEAIKSLFVDWEHSFRGKYRVRLFDITQDTWRTITIDGNIPFKDGGPIFTKPSGKELWVLLLEKAMAKFCGSYSNIAGGFEAWGLRILTGNHVWTFRRLKPRRVGEPGQWRRYEFRFKPSSDTKRDASCYGTGQVHESDSFWPVLLAYTQGHKGVMLCSVNNMIEKVREDGLLENHGYSIVGAVDLHSEKLIKIRNPWGKKGQWRGHWSDGSSQWKASPLISVATGHENSDNNNTFWMCWEDFRQVWTEVTVCSRSTNVINLAIDTHEELGCQDLCVGFLEGWFGSWCICRGCPHIFCLVKNKERQAVEIGDRPLERTGSVSATTAKHTTTENSRQDVARSPNPPSAANEAPGVSSSAGGAPTDKPISSSVTGPWALDENHCTLLPAAAPDTSAQDSLSDVPQEKGDTTTLVRKFGSTPGIFSSVNAVVRLHVRPGSLRRRQVAGPITIQTTGAYMVECDGCMHLVSAIVDCQPSGSKFDVALALDFRVGENPDEQDEDVEAEVDLDYYKESLRESYKLLLRDGSSDPWEAIGEDNTDVIYERGMFFMRARIDHFSQGCLAKKIQLENAIHEELVTWPSWAPPKKNQLGFVNVTNKPLIFLVLPTSWSNQAILSVAMGLAFEGLEASVAISKAVQKSILSEATHPQVLQVPCTQKKGSPKVGQVFPSATCTLPKVTGSEARVALITANSDTVEVWDYRIVQHRTWVWVLPGQFSEGMIPLLGRHHRRELAREEFCLMNVALVATAKGLQPANENVPISTISSASIEQG